MISLSLVIFNLVLLFSLFEFIWYILYFSQFKKERHIFILSNNLTLKYLFHSIIRWFIIRRIFMTCFGSWMSKVFLPFLKFVLNHTTSYKTETEEILFWFIKSHSNSFIIKFRVCNNFLLFISMFRWLFWKISFIFQVSVDLKGYNITRRWLLKLWLKSWVFNCKSWDMNFYSICLV